MDATSRSAVTSRQAKGDAVRNAGETLEVRDFYDALADHYDLIYADWRSSARRQGAALHRVITEQLGEGPRHVLDCTCGIGTQALALAELGHQVVGTDVSSRAIERARREAAELGLTVRFEVADLRTLAEGVEGGFDVVLSCDNSLPHLLSEEELRRGIRGMGSVVKPDGLLLASIRDYDTLMRDRPEATPIMTAGPEGGRRVGFQLWSWKTDGRHYDLELFLLKEGPEGWGLRSHRVEYRGILRDELEAIVREEGGRGVRWSLPEESGFFQPLLSAAMGSRSMGDGPRTEP